MSVLAKRCQLLMPSLSRIINHLTKERLIERRVVDSDQRRAKIALTASGKALYEKVVPKSVERYNEIEKLYGVRKLELLYELLDDLINTLEEK